MKTREHRIGRQIEVRGMAYGPTTELGVVFLFGRLAPQLGFCVENVRPHFPDCLATRKGRRVQIEFELWASDYANHGHAAKGADIVVCWENDWESRPKKYQHLEVISLKDLAGAMPRVFVVGCDESISGEVLRYSRIDWNMHTSAQVGDLALIYRSAPTSAILDLWKVVGPFRNYGKRNKEGYWPGLQAGLRRLVTLKRPLTFAALSRDPRTRELSVVRKRFQGKMDITEDWPILHKRIVALNPSARKALRPFLPE